MRHSFIDEHSTIESPLSRLDPRVKVAGFLGLAACIALTDRLSFPAFMLYGMLVALLAFLSRIPPAYILKRSLVIAPFIFMAAFFVPFVQEGHKLFSIGPDSAGFAVYSGGLAIFCGLAVKSFLSVISLIILTSGTPFPSLLKALQDLRVPSIIIMVLSFMYRYFFIIEDEFMKMKQARESRLAGGSALTFRSLANMTGVLFIRSYERSEAVYMAMCSRGFSGEIITPAGPMRLRNRDIVFLFFMALSLTGIQWFGHNG